MLKFSIYSRASFVRKRKSSKMFAYISHNEKDTNCFMLLAAFFQKLLSLIFRFSNSYCVELFSIGYFTKSFLSTRDARREIGRSGAQKPAELLSSTFDPRSSGVRNRKRASARLAEQTGSITIVVRSVCEGSETSGGEAKKEVLVHGLPQGCGERSKQKNSLLCASDISSRFPQGVLAILHRP